VKVENLKYRSIIRGRYEVPRGSGVSKSCTPQAGNILDNFPHARTCALLGDFSLPVPLLVLDWARELVMPMCRYGSLATSDQATREPVRLAWLYDNGSSCQVDGVPVTTV